MMCFDIQKKGIANKLLIILICSLTLAQSISAQYVKTEKELFGLLGKVKTVISESAKIVNEAGRYNEADRQHSRTTTYDLQGNVIKEDPVPGKEGRPITNGDSYREEPRIKLFYNKQGKVVRELQVLKDGTILDQSEYRYDRKGRLFEWRFLHLKTSANKLELTGRWIYRRWGQTVKSTLYQGCCSVKRWELSAFNKRGDIIETASYRGDGSLIYKTVYAYKYDSAGNWVQRKIFSWTSKEGKSFYVPEEVSYRTITYY